MDFTPEDMEAVQVFLEGIDRDLPVKVEPAAAVLLISSSVRTVGDILSLPVWPAERLRLTVERWPPDIEVRGYAEGRSAEGRSAPAAGGARPREAPLDADHDRLLAPGPWRKLSIEGLGGSIKA
jgi:hypothetical protein